MIAEESSSGEYFTGTTCSEHESDCYAKTELKVRSKSLWLSWHPRAFVYKLKAAFGEHGPLSAAPPLTLA